MLQVKEIFKKTQDLSIEDRKKLIKKIKKSNQIEKAWLDECERRIKLLDEGKTDLHTMNEVFEEIDTEFGFK